MNPDALVWLAGCILFLASICTVILAVWSYLAVENINAMQRGAIKFRQRQGRMTVKPVNL
jgi:hypothetical protein